MAEAAELQKMKLAELRQECETRGLDAKGNKAELVGRLQAHLEGHGGEDVVVDVVEHITEEELVVEDGDVDQEVLLTEKTEEEEDFAKDEGGAAAAAAADNDVQMDEKEEEEEDRPPGSPEKTNVVKISPPVSTGEKLLQRAKRFNMMATSAEGKKAVRTARFALPDHRHEDEEVVGHAAQSPSSSSPSPAGGAVLGSNNNNNNNSNNNSGDSAVSVDQLKKRAERFGAVSAVVLQQAEGEERLRKRRARFGFGGSLLAEGTEHQTTAEAKRRKRVERFRKVY